MKRKGFTLVELLVVISIIALLMGILMPALAKVRSIAYQMMCGTKLSGIGKAMLVYSADWDDRYPRAARPSDRWTNTGIISDWTGQTPPSPYRPGQVTVTASLYLLVKYADVQPKQFVCKGDMGTEEFSLSNYAASLPVCFELEDAWDFGGAANANLGQLLPGQYCSYAYHLPYSFPDPRPSGSGNVSFEITMTSRSGSPLCADRNPYLDKNAVSTYLQDTTLADPSWDASGNNYLDRDKKGNSACHQREGQNVLYSDIHVTFEKAPNVGIEEDNIWKYWPNTSPNKQEMQVGDSSDIFAYAPTKNGDGFPMDRKDAYLVGEKNE